jgi:hypothetical protein
MDLAGSDRQVQALQDLAAVDFRVQILDLKHVCVLCVMCAMQWAQYEPSAISN